MKRVTLKNILTISVKTLNCMDSRLTDHVEMVAYIFMKLLEVKGGYSFNEIVDLTTVALFHDIGAYKVEERTNITDIDGIKSNNHAVYGYLFIKDFSPLSKYAEVVLGHHFNHSDVHKVNVPEEAFILKAADYISIRLLNNKYFNKNDILNLPENYLCTSIRELIIRAEEHFKISDSIKSGKYLNELWNLFDLVTVREEEIISYKRMLTYSLDFRSESTVRHTIIVESISRYIASKLDMPQNVVNKITVAAVLHDIGKIIIPVEILEKKGPLTSEEMEVMKMHSKMGYFILSNVGIDEIRDIASYHHEKLDGSGYPFGLTAESLSKEARIVAVADIMSALIGKRSYKDYFDKEKVIKILNDMVEEGKIDGEIVQLVISEYDNIVEFSKRDSKEIWDIYDGLQEGYDSIMKKLY